MKGEKMTKLPAQLEKDIDEVVRMIRVYVMTDKKDARLLKMFNKIMVQYILEEPFSGNYFLDSLKREFERPEVVRRNQNARHTTESLL